MTDLEEIFTELGISHYLQEFLENGFDTWETILDITESDFDALGVKLGHRRKLQRKIANSRGFSSDRALHSPRHTPSEDRPAEEQKNGNVKTEGKDEGTRAEIKEGGAAQGAKRKYRRHPKPDEHAPERPPSAYVIFSNKMREELKGRNLSFTEIAKLVGVHWQNLLPSEKEPYEQQALAIKERYNNMLAEYKKTDHYREYSTYLAEFKAKQSNQQQATDAEVSKRPKLEAQISTASSGTTSSVTSQSGDMAPRTHVESSPSNASPWLPPDGQPSPQTTPMPKLSLASGATQGQSSPPLTSPTILPGYRDSIYPGGHSSLVWREAHHRDDNNQSLSQFPRMSGVENRHSPFSGPPSADSLNPTGSLQHSHRTGQSHPPPSLTSELTSRSTGSSVSTVSSTYLSPRTPMEPPLDRALPIPMHYSQKSPPSFDHQLPPLRPPSSSPGATSLGAQQSPNGIHPISDFPHTMAPMRTFTGAQNDQAESRMREYMPARGTEDNNNLDPVSALLKADEVLNRSSRGRHPGS